ncbi:MAG: hypothetical protein ABWK00_04175 [Desulfurococcaceae archaeon]
MPTHGSNEAEVREYWFSRYYHTLLVRAGERYVVIVDVYRRGWRFGETSRECVADGNVCLIYYRASPGDLGLGELADGAIEVEIVGLLSGEGAETISVRWYLPSKPNESEVERLFELSWRLVGCERPRDDSFILGCG